MEKLMLRCTSAAAAQHACTGWWSGCLPSLSLCGNRHTDRQTDRQTHRQTDTHSLLYILDRRIPEKKTGRAELRRLFSGHGMAKACNFFSRAELRRLKGGHTANCCRQFRLRDTRKRRVVCSLDSGHKRCS